MAKGDLLGLIDCPHCGLEEGMRVTEDKNSEPFGFCEAECDGQLRVGGKSRRVEKFYQLHPHLRKRPVTAPAPQVAAGAVLVAPAKADAAETPPPAKPVRPRVATLLG